MVESEAAVVVLGDIGRSPRISFHALSLATELSYRVSLIGYLDTKPGPLIDNHPLIRYVPIKAPPDFLNRLPVAIGYGIKLLWTFFTLFCALFFRTGFKNLKLILLQNPPGLPSMFVCKMVATMKGSLFVIDWHNYTWSVLKEKFHVDDLHLPRLEEETNTDADGQKKRRKTKAEVEAEKHSKKLKRKPARNSSLRHWLVESIYSLEGYFGRCAHANLCVTRAMAADLKAAWGIEAVVFYDLPPLWKFGEVTPKETHEMFRRLAQDSDLFLGDEPAAVCDEYTRFTVKTGDEVLLREDRPFLLVSSTSWTEDEDFGILLDALRHYNDVAKVSRLTDERTNVPRVLCVITGRGPMKEFYLTKIARLQLETVDITTPWLEAEDYPRLLSAADLGVCLHTSTSSLDLPMKVVDMFGARLPVLAKSFASIGELVHNGKDGILFDTAQELSESLIQLTTGHPIHCAQLKNLSSYLRGEGKLATWEENWRAVAQPLLSQSLHPRFDRVLAN